MSPPTVAPIRAAIYTRISRDPTGTHLGTDRQEADCRALCAARGWTVAAIFTDNDLSAYSGRRRPGYLAMMAALAAGSLDAITALNPDRLHRSPVELEAFIAAVEAKGAAVAMVGTGTYDLTTADGRLSARIVGATARHSSERSAERIRRQQLDMAAAGRPHGGGSRPYGFNDDRRTHRVAEAANVREVTAAILAGASLRSVCKRLNDRGALTVRGRRWDSPHLTTMLLRPRMVGQRSYNGATTPATWHPIITEAQQAGLRLVMASRSSAGRGQPPMYLLSGLLFCDVCGAKMKHCPPWRTRPATYQCPADRGDRGGKQCVVVQAERAEALITAVTLAESDSVPVETVAAPPVVGGTSVLDDREREAAVGFADGRITLMQLQAITTELESQRAALVARMAQAAEADAKAAQAQRLALRLRSLWPTLPLPERRDAIRTVLGKITVSRAGKALDWPMGHKMPDGTVVMLKPSADELFMARFDWQDWQGQPPALRVGD
jgi:site-specific DNA recombinase